MQKAFNWFDRLPASGKTWLVWVLLATVAVGLGSLYLVFDTPGALFACAAAFVLFLLRIRYPNQQPSALPVLPRYICCAPVIWINDNDEEYECWFHLYEHPDRRREAIYSPCAMQRSRDHDALGRRHVIYNKVILPWLNHAYTNEAVIEYFAQPRLPKPSPPKTHPMTTKGGKVITLDQFRPK